MSTIAVIGAGSFGTALAMVAARAGHDVRLWSHSKDVALSLERDRENPIYLPGFSLPSNIVPSGDLARVVSHAELVLVVVPSHVCREVYSQLKPLLTAEMIIVSATKGIEISSVSSIGNILKGPDFAGSAGLKAA